MFLQLRVVLSLDFRKSRSFLQRAPQVFLVESSVNIGCFREPLPFLYVHKSQKLCFQSSVNIGCFSEPPTIVGIRSPHHFFREPPTFLQLRVVLLLDFRKPPSFLQGAPNNLYLRVASILDVLGSPRHFSSFTRVERFVCQETPTIVGKGSPHHLFREPPMFFFLRVLLLLEFRKPPHYFFGEPPTFCIGEYHQ